MTAPTGQFDYGYGDPDIADAVNHYLGQRPPMSAEQREAVRQLFDTSDQVQTATP